MNLRPATLSDFDALLALNEESVHFLSPLDRPRLAHLHAQSALHLVVDIEGEVAAFVLAFREGADYDSVNYHWFAENYPTFLYVDRIVVSPQHQRRGLGRLLYQAVFEKANASQVSIVTCEFDIDPPNPTSERFHESFGFREVGRQAVAGGKKWVSLQAVEVG